MIHESSIHAGYLGRVAGRGAHGVIVCRYQPPPTYYWTTSWLDVWCLFKESKFDEIFTLDFWATIDTCVLFWRFGYSPPSKICISVMLNSLLYELSIRSRHLTIEMAGASINISVYQSDVNLLLKFLANANIILIDKGYKTLKCLLLQCHR